MDSPLLPIFVNLQKSMKSYLPALFWISLEKNLVLGSGHEKFAIWNKKLTMTGGNCGISPLTHLRLSLSPEMLGRSSSIVLAIFVSFLLTEITLLWFWSHFLIMAEHWRNCNGETWGYICHISCHRSRLAFFYAFI